MQYGNPDIFPIQKKNNFRMINYFHDRYKFLLYSFKLDFLVCAVEKLREMQDEISLLYIYIFILEFDRIVKNGKILIPCIVPKNKHIIIQIFKIELSIL